MRTLAPYFFAMTSDLSQTSSWPLLGCGVGLRAQHYEKILTEKPAVDWFEATSENYMTTGGRPLWVLEQVRRDYPVALHGVSLSIGSVDPLNREYLHRLRALVGRIEPAMVSDHLCWASVERKNLHDLLPLPFTEEALDHIVRRVDEVQTFLGRRILLENTSSYVTFQHSVMPEWQFLSEVARRSGCGILLDINNVYVNAVNHGFDPRDFVRGVPADAVGYCHLAGHTNMGSWLFDTHSKLVIEPVWALYKEALDLWGKKSTLVEWDEDIPAWDELAAEADRARIIYAAAPESGRRDVVLNGSPRSIAVSGASGVSGTSGSSLADVQRWMRRRIYPELNEGGSDRPSMAGATAGAVDVKLNPQGGEPGEARLEVYAGGYTARIAESLKEVYEAVRHVLGEGVFTRVAQDFAETRPSRHYDLGLAGRDFAVFLKNAKITEKLPFLPDLAFLEWRVAEAFHAYDSAPLAAAAMNEVAPEDWERLIFSFRESVSLFRSAWPVVDIWRARHTPVEKFDLEIMHRPQCALVHRSGFRVACEAIESEEFAVLQALKAGRTLGSVLDEAASDLESRGQEDAVLPLEVWFSRWSGLGLFASIHLGEPHAV